jgi:hypothetical protein
MLAAVPFAVLQPCSSSFRDQKDATEEWCSGGAVDTAINQITIV